LATTIGLRADVEFTDIARLPSRSALTGRRIDFDVDAAARRILASKRGARTDHGPLHLERMPP
jgi:hypothetical protein